MLKCFFDRKPSLRDPKQWHPLHIAAECGNITLFKQFVEKTGLIHPSRNDGQTPFHFASAEGHFAVCKFIIENVEDRNPKDIWGETPLDLATMCRYQDIKTFSLFCHRFLYSK